MKMTVGWLILVLVALLTTEAAGAGTAASGSDILILAVTTVVAIAATAIITYMSGNKTVRDIFTHKIKVKRPDGRNSDVSFQDVLAASFLSMEGISETQKTLVNQQQQIGDLLVRLEKKL